MTADQRVRRLLLALMLALPLGPALANYPERTINLIVPFPAGGTTDIVARIVAEQLATEYGRSVVIENRGGASTTIGAQAVANAEKDGHTLLFTAATTFTTNPHLLPAIRYKLEDFAPVAMVVKVPFAFVVRKGFPADDVKSLRDYARAHAGKINNATNGAGSTVHLLGELVARELGITVAHVHYRGAAPAMNDMLAGVIDTNVEALANATQNHVAGQYKALAVLSPKRLPQLPEVPTFSELGYPGIVGESWFAVFAPAGTAKPIIEQLNASISRIVRSADFRQRMEAIGNEPTAMTPDELDSYVRAESQRLGKLIKDAGITIQ
ncbi:hypothetical protein IP69_08910 [Bosea sp. AAP35]|uniref:Bug family tripartite tricarboxylate transporter substrate binding protein n=1 Tax=Bosea sp. AAP35 TaxID=1523417 RepID=UPI0006B89D7A|nr:tripartite tricarboxylate transporter substrate binding protein [Bosea sp. AAP35]KPF70849.1 hypothetical protein IP69_08910 [Bosea sp. AAP35]